MRLSLFILAIGAAYAQNYVRDVFPIWEKHCLGCHASGTTMGSLDIETWEGLQRGGNNGTILVPGDPSASRLYTMLTGEVRPAMPMDGKVLSAAEIEAVRQWIATGAKAPSVAEIALLQKRATGELTPITAAVWRPDSRELALGRATGVDLVNPTTQALRRLTVPNGPVRALAYSPDGSLLAVAASREVLLWQSGRQRAKLPEQAGTLAFSPDGRSLATAGEDHRIHLWDVATARKRLTLSGHEQPVLAMAFSPDGRSLISATAQGAVKIWRTLTGDCRLTLSLASPGQPIAALALSPNGRQIAVVDGDHQVSLWTVSDAPPKVVSRLTRQSPVATLSWSLLGLRLLLRATDGTLVLVNTPDLTVLRTFPRQPEPPDIAALSPDETQLVVGFPYGTFALINLIPQ